MTERLEPVEDRLRRHHREVMRLWRLPNRSEYENQVVRLALDTLGGRREPANHPHALQEIGMCAICDADALARIEQEGRESFADASEEVRRAIDRLRAAVLDAVAGSRLIRLATRVARRLS